MAVGVMVLLVVGLAVLWWLATRPEAPAEEEDAPARDGRPADAYERWAYLDEAPAEEPTDEPAEGPANDPEAAARRARFEARRAAWQERWRRAVEIAPLGERAPRITPDAIREALAPSRERLRECVGESGGWRGLFEARRAQWAERREAEPAPEGGRGRRGRGPRSRVSFDVRPDGSVDPSSLRFDPPMPEAYAACFEEHFLSLQLEGAGDGASVELPMGPPGGRRRRGAFGDGGVPSGSWRGREGGGRPSWRERGDRGASPRDEPPAP